MDFTDILRNISIPEGIKGFTTHATALLLLYSRPSRDVRSVLELGSGIGVVSVAIAKLYGRRVVGIEINSRLVEIAREVAEMNGVGDLVDFVQGDVSEIKSMVKVESFDMVISNPPHHQGKTPSPYPDRALARNLGTPSIFVEAIAWALRNRGEFTLVLSPENMIDWIDLLRRKRLEPKRMVFFHPKDKAELVAIRGRKNAGVGLTVDPPIRVSL